MMGGEFDARRYHKGQISAPVGPDPLHHLSICSYHYRPITQAPTLPHQPCVLFGVSQQDN